MPTTLITRATAGNGATVKGAPLSSAEIDANFLSLNNNKIEIGSAATQLGYSNDVSGLVAINVQAAIDEIASDLGAITLTADNVSYDNTVSSLTATDVKGAIDELAGSIGEGGGSLSVTNDTTTNSSFFPTFSSVTSGTTEEVYTSSTKLSFNPNTGTLSATNLNTLSDAKYKKNVVSITSAMDILNRITGVEFDWKDNTGHSAGIIAQELMKVLPHLVNTNERGHTVNYLGIIAYLIEANKELNTKIGEIQDQMFTQTQPQQQP